MVRQRMQQCLSCGKFSLKIACPFCGERAQAAAPLKWSPEDHRAGLRRKMKQVEDKQWTESLPTLPSLKTMQTLQEEE